MIVVTIFLDFDGVLHPTWARSDRLFEKTGLLNEVIASCRSIEFFVSSSWAAHMDHGKILHRLQPFPELQRLVVGQTRQGKRLAMDFGDLPEREAQCRNWLHENARHQTRWLAIEDDAACFKSRDNVIKTDGNFGLIAANIESLKTKILALQNRNSEATYIADGC